VFSGAGEGSLRALAHRLTKRTVLRGMSLFYDVEGAGGEGARGEHGGSGGDPGGGAGSGFSAAFFVVMEGDVLVTIPTPAATAEAAAAADRYEYQ